ncbi:MAG: hypothetical protein A2Y62_09350 [Candidatus Fischerbacteria bacterium RBG_13_37_8]|uniref:AAA+ ATPase domain-containing protein n=1 Tax=Candidatus Fischerbacteria bacterium RBG_13_37_8 TaxID=1817863 RepID=A0A1F5VJW0_9BACT|nr:MAG: hypothetical protein A2Y62_09350 [Candidatus Fischerbacteria bacterium RBG_13_37_8]
MNEIASEGITSLKEMLSNFDREEAKKNYEESEKERMEVIRLFPLDQWPQLELEKYALGLEKNTYCHLLEFKTTNIGSIKGGSSAKHIIYLKHKDSSWYIPLELKKQVNNEKEAWEKIRENFVKTFLFAREMKWDEIDDIPYGPSLRLKSIYIYFPDKILPIFSKEHLIHFLNALGIEADRNLERATLNSILLQNLRQIPELKEWNTKELAFLLYKWAHPEQSIKVFKISPGEDAIYWQECLSNNYICVGWDKTGDLKSFESQKEFKHKFFEEYGDEYKQKSRMISKKSKELWTLMELEPGDKIVANKGKSEVLALGEVIEPGYEWIDDRGSFCHVVHVNWDTKYAKKITPQEKWAFVTVAEIDAKLYKEIIGSEEMKSITDMPKELIIQQIEVALENKKQIILYGPPGTGKTYHARRFAIWWLLKKLKYDNPNEVLINNETLIDYENRLKTVKISNKVWWVVANPKQWSWDMLFKDKKVDFHLGRIQKNYPLVKQGDLVIGYQSNPDKKIVALAKISKEFNTSPNDEDKIELEPLVRVRNGIEYEELLRDNVLKNCEPMRLRNQGTLFALNHDEADYLLSLLAERDNEIDKYIQQPINESSIGHFTMITFHASYSYEDFIEGYRPVPTSSENLVLRIEDGIFKRVCQQALADSNKPYLILIDEINRANVAKVLGETITLLEKDKRGLKITLPQSKEPFQIPDNVYIIATMNTADRSIKHIDAAIRRRFAFVELMPDTNILVGAKIGDFELDEFLEELNKRIAKKEGREKQIGHSFFLEKEKPVTDPEIFAQRFRHEILPLLQEYCYADYSALADYLGNELVDKDEHAIDYEILNNPERLIKALNKALISDEG